MNGVKIPLASAGSNQAGASDTATAQTTWPAGASARADGASATTAALVVIAAASANAASR